MYHFNYINYIVVTIYTFLQLLLNIMSIWVLY